MAISEPINRSWTSYQSFILTFSFVGMCFEEPRLDCSSSRASFKGMCFEEQKEPKPSMLSCNLLRRLSLLSDFKIKKHRFRCFHGCALTDKIQLLENFSSGRKWPLLWSGSISLQPCHCQLWGDFVSWSLLEISFLRSMHPCSANAPFALIDETRACWLLSLKFL